MTKEERAIEESIRTGRSVDLEKGADRSTLSTKASYEDEEGEYGGYYDRWYTTYSGIRNGVPWTVRVRDC